MHVQCTQLSVILSGKWVTFRLLPLLGLGAKTATQPEATQARSERSLVFIIQIATCA